MTVSISESLVSDESTSTSTSIRTKGRSERSVRARSTAIVLWNVASLRNCRSFRAGSAGRITFRRLFSSRELTKESSACINSPDLDFAATIPYGVTVNVADPETTREPEIVTVLTEVTALVVTENVAVA